MNNLPTLTDIENILAEKPEIRAQVSRKGVINSALPDALRLKTEAIELRKQLVENKASLDAYASRREQSKQQIEHAEKTLAALKTCRAKKTPTTAAPPASPLTGLARTAAAFARDASPKSPTPNRPSTAPLTGIARTTAAFRRDSASK